MASLEEPPEPSTFIRQSTSSQDSAVVMIIDVPARSATFTCLGHAKGTTEGISASRHWVRPVGLDE